MLQDHQSEFRDLSAEVQYRAALARAQALSLRNDLESLKDYLRHAADYLRIASENEKSLRTLKYWTAEKRCGPWFDKLTMRSKPLKSLDLILSLSKDEAGISIFSAAF